METGNRQRTVTSKALLSILAGISRRLLCLKSRWANVLYKWKAQDPKTVLCPSLEVLRAM